MDITQRLVQVADAGAAVFHGGEDVRDLCREASAEIQHLRRFAQHLPECELVKFRVSEPATALLGNDLCDCGLIRTI